MMILLLMMMRMIKNIFEENAVGYNLFCAIECEMQISCNAIQCVAPFLKYHIWLIVDKLAKFRTTFFNPPSRPIFSLTPRLTDRLTNHLTGMVTHQKIKINENDRTQRRPGVGVGGQGSQSDLSVGPLSLQRYLPPYPSQGCLFMID